MKKLILSAILIFFVNGCASYRRVPASDKFFPTAVIEPSDVMAAIEFEQALRKNETNSPVNWFELLPGKGTVLVTAPHATPHVREGRTKFADAGSGGLAFALNQNECSRTPVLLTTSMSPSDPNFYDTNEFKAALAAYISTNRPTLILDLHVSNSQRPYDIDFGTMNGRSLLGKRELLKKLIAALQKEGLSNFSQDYFSASRNNTVVKFAAERGIPAIQCEINAVWVAPDGKTMERDHRFAQILQAFVRYVEDVNANKN